MTAPPGTVNAQQTVTIAPPSFVVGKPEGAAVPPPPAIVTTTQIPSSFRNSQRPLNLGGGTFNAAQQFYPASGFEDSLPKYAPNLPGRRRRPTTTPVPNLTDFGVRLSHSYLLLTIKLLRLFDLYSKMSFKGYKWFLKRNDTALPRRSSTYFAQCSFYLKFYYHNLMMLSHIFEHNLYTKFINGLIISY